MNVFQPMEPHADLDPDARCDIHDRTPLHVVQRWTPTSREPRFWHITGAELVRASLLLSNDVALGARAPAGLTLNPGTRLRLDASSGAERYYDGGEHDSTTRRFCVLDGPMAGTCWEANESVAADGSWRSADPVAPIPEGDPIDRG